MGTVRIARCVRAARGACAAAVLLGAAAGAARAQSAYIGFAHPAGGRQGTTFRVTLGGQALEGVSRVLVSGAGVTGRVVEYNKKMSPQEIQLLNEQRQELRRIPAAKRDAAASSLLARLDKFIGDYVNQPQCAAIANLVVAEIAIAANAEPGPRELRVAAARGLSNPLVFHVGQLPEVTAPPLPTTPLAILGKEGESLRRKKREEAPAAGGEMMMEGMMMGGAGAPTDLDDAEVRLTLPCTVNGQIAAGTVDRFRFAARQGQKLVIATQARELVPYMADAVPGWFQPVLALGDARGREVAYNDDYGFRPDPVILCTIPADGDYTLAIHDAIFRGREDFVYRISIGELPFVTGIFPLGATAGAAASVAVQGWNLGTTRAAAAPADARPGVYPLAVRGRGGLLANRVPFAVDELPDCLEKEPNDTPRAATRPALPTIVNGRIGAPGDRDVFAFRGRKGEVVVAEVIARRLDSPLDAELKLTDAEGACLGFSDDVEDPGAGLTTHHADACVRATLPADGDYFLHLRDAQHRGGDAFAYRLRLSPPRPDFALRAVPSHVEFRNSATASLAVHVARRDGFAGRIDLSLQNPPEGYRMQPASLTGTQTVVRVTLSTSLTGTNAPVNLAIVGTATNAAGLIVRAAVPAEDRMQAFLWRHLVPAQELKAIVLNKAKIEPGKPWKAGKGAAARAAAK